MKPNSHELYAAAMCGVVGRCRRSGRLVGCTYQAGHEGLHRWENPLPRTGLAGAAPGKSGSHTEGRLESRSSWNSPKATPRDPARPVRTPRDPEKSGSHTGRPLESRSSWNHARGSDTPTPPLEKSGSHTGHPLESRSILE